MISVEDLLHYIDEALDGMVAIVTGLGDELANRKPDLPGANSPYALLTHCLGVMESWGGHVIAGRTIERDRDAEFVATGPVAELVERTRRARRQLAEDLTHLDPSAPPRGAVDPEDALLPLGRTQGGALVHLYEELAQHRGQMEGCRDVLLAPWARVRPGPTATGPLPDGQRAAFAVPDGVAYFNTASLGPMLRRALEAGHEALRRRSQPWTVEARDWFDDAERLRSLVGALMGADAEGVALVPATSYGMAVAATNLVPRGRAGRAVLVLADEFPSGIHTWRRFAARTGAPIVTVDREAGQAWTEAVLAALDERIGVVSVPNVHWTDGSFVDLDAVARRAREVDAALVVDASQSLGALPLDVTTLRPDYVVSVGYKWLLGPVGRGYLWVAEQHRDGEPVEENWIVRAGADDFAGLVGYRDEYQPGARRFDAGGRTLLETTPMAIAAVEQVMDWGVGRIATALGAVTATIADRLAALGLAPTAPAGGRGPHILGITVPDGARTQVLPALERESCYVGLRGTSLRIAPHLHVTEADIDALVAAVASAL